MTINLMNKYIEITKNYITKYMKLVFEYKYDKEICDSYLYTYVNVRYNNFFKEDLDSNLTLRKKIIYSLKSKTDYLIENYNEKKQIINNMGIFFLYIMYFDDVIKKQEIKNQVENIYKLRIKVLNKKDEEFKINLFNILNEWNEEKNKFLNKFESKEFNLKISNYRGIKNVYRVNLEQNIKFPMIFSEIAINKVFNNGIINEDKLYIEYYLITVKIIRDILKQDFKKQYIVEFAKTLLEKNKKIKGILNIIEHQAVQDKINLKLKYKDYDENKEQIYELMRSGFKIAIILDNSFEVNYINLEKLNMFSYILINKNLDNYSEIIKNKNILKNIIEI